MLQLKNKTPFEAAIAVFPDEKAVDHLYIMVKATFSIGAKVAVAAAQSPLVMADVYWDEPGRSSIRYAAEYHLMKPSSDIVMAGSACAPDKRPVQSLDVTLSAGNCRKTIRVFGERRWITGMVGLDISKPVPFESMPLVYERAFGGDDRQADDSRPVLYEPRNPVGIGYLGKRRPGALKGTPLPNLEDPAHLIRDPGDRPPPAGFSFIAPSWHPRSRYAGTYDEHWNRKRAPYLPDDFDPRFFNAASPGLTYETFLQGGEPVMISNMSPDGPLQFVLPRVDLAMDIRLSGKRHNAQPNLETLFLEPEEKRMSLLWRACMACDKKVLKVEEVNIDLQQLDLS